MDEAVAHISRPLLDDITRDTTQASRRYKRVFTGGFATWACTILLGCCIFYACQRSHQTPFQWDRTVYDSLAMRRDLINVAGAPSGSDRVSERDELIRASFEGLNATNLTVRLLDLSRDILEDTMELQGKCRATSQDIMDVEKEALFARQRAKAKLTFCEDSLLHKKMGECVKDMQHAIQELDEGIAGLEEYEQDIEEIEQADEFLEDVTRNVVLSWEGITHDVSEYFSRRVGSVVNTSDVLRRNGSDEAASQLEQAASDLGRHQQDWEWSWRETRAFEKDVVQDASDVEWDILPAAAYTLNGSHEDINGSTTMTLSVMEFPLCPANHSRDALLCTSIVVSSCVKDIYPNVTEAWRSHEEREKARERKTSSDFEFWTDMAMYAVDIWDISAAIFTLGEAAPADAVATTEARSFRKASIEAFRTSLRAGRQTFKSFRAEVMPAYRRISRESTSEFALRTVKSAGVIWLKSYHSVLEKILQFIEETMKGFRALRYKVIDSTKTLGTVLKGCFAGECRSGIGVLRGFHNMKTALKAGRFQEAWLTGKKFGGSLWKVCRRLGTRECRAFTKAAYQYDAEIRPALVTRAGFVGKMAAEYVWSKATGCKEKDDEVKGGMTCKKVLSWAEDTFVEKATGLLIDTVEKTVIQVAVHKMHISGPALEKLQCAAKQSLPDDVRTQINAAAKKALDSQANEVKAKVTTVCVDLAESL